MSLDAVAVAATARAHATCGHASGAGAVMRVIIRSRQQRPAQLGGRTDHMLAVIQHQQQLPASRHPSQRIRHRPAGQLTWSCLLEVIVALAGIGTAVTLYPVLKRQHEGIALGFVTSRLLEGSMIFAGVVSLLSPVTLRHGPGAAGANAAALVATSASHVAVYNWTFLLGQSLMPAINAILLGTLLYRSRLVPRFLPVLGLIGAPDLRQ